MRKGDAAQNLKAPVRVSSPKILILEDNQVDADLLLRELKRSGLIFTYEVVENGAAYENALQRFNPDLILSDYALPSFDAVSAFKIKQIECPHVPFIIVSGTIGEEIAVELIKSGVTDYTLKDKLFTLSPKIDRALNDMQAGKERAFANEKIKVQAESLIIVNRELVVQNKEKENRAADLAILSGNLKVQKDELHRANKLLIKQEEKVNLINLELSQLNLELEKRVANRTKALAESETRFRNMIETLPQIAWTNTVEGEFIYYNQRWYDYTGLDNTHNTIRGFNLLIHPDDLKNGLDQFRSVLKIGNGGEFQLRGKRADGLYRWHLVRLMPIKNEAGQMQLWMGTATDIQELKLLQQQKDDFISIASHELKTPIKSLKGSLQLLEKIKDNPLSPMLPKLITLANKSLDKMNALIEDLLDASKANEGQLHINQQPFVISKMIDDCCYYVCAEEIYTITTSGNMELEAFADAARIEQIIVNFINNAIKYAPGSKEILISIEKVNDTAKISVSDKGPGIPVEKVRYLFDRYYRVDSSGSQYTGLGLGLYICAEIIKKHNGQIGVDSVLGKGSTFWFTLPVAAGTLT